MKKLIVILSFCLMALQLQAQDVALLNRIKATNGKSITTAARQLLRDGAQENKKKKSLNSPTLLESPLPAPPLGECSEDDATTDLMDETD